MVVHLRGNNDATAHPSAATANLGCLEVESQQGRPRDLQLVKLILELKLIIPNA